MDYRKLGKQDYDDSLALNAESNPLAKRELNYSAIVTAVAIAFPWSLLFGWLLRLWFHHHR